MRYILLLLFIVLAAFLMSPNQTSAQTSPCKPIFNGGQTCVQDPDLSINKQIKTPNANTYQDSLLNDNNRIAIGGTVNFRINIKNNSNGDMTNIQVNDVLPSYLIYNSGNGTIDKNTNTFSAKIDKLTKGQTKILAITATVASNIPASPSPFCLNNVATVKSGNNTSSDVATFCIDNTKVQAQRNNPTQANTNMNTTKGGLPLYAQISPTQTPGTGPELLGLVSLPALAMSGWILKRANQKK